MARENVPQFGNWESEDNVPCTVYFDKAKKNKGGKIVNPNDPQENSDMFPAQTKRPRSRRSVESDELPKRVAPKSSSQSQLSKEDSGEYRHSATSAHGNHTGTRGGVVNESSHGGQSGRRVGGRSTRRPRPPSVVSDCSIDWSPYNIDRFLTPSRLCLVREYGYNDFSMVNHRGTNPVSEDSPPSNISQQSNKDSKAKGGCLPFHFPFAGPKKKRT